MPEERPGIVGLETEHVVLFVPHDEGACEPGVSSRQPPPFALLEMVLFESLLAGRKAAKSSGLKGGYFLENGGLAHMEIYLHTQADSPILEVSTPECRSPHDVVVYSRAFDEILEETSRRSEALLAKYGYAGRIAFGKNNRDSRGIGFGCHENYLVHWLPSRLDQALKVLALPLLYACYIPVFLFFLLMLLIALCFFALHAVSFIRSSVQRVGRLIEANWPRLLERCRGVYLLISTAALCPFIQLYSFLVRHLVFRNYIRGLTPHLVTRQALTGAGWLNFKDGAYELSQRAGLTTSVAMTIMFGRWKTMFDLKGFLFDRAGFFSINAPLALFWPTRRLSIAAGDSNLSDIPCLLKLGTTLLLIEMIEAGETFVDLQLRAPLRAMRAISLGGPWKQVRVGSRGMATAVDIQREYLRRAQAFFKDRPEGHLKHGEVLRAWQEALEKLSERPQGLAGALDWAAKKAMLDRAVLGATNWKVFFAWGKVFHLAGIRAAAQAASLPELLARLPFLRRVRVRRAVASMGLDPADLETQRDLHFQARKIDLRYHELGGGTSYQRALEAEGCIERLTSEEAVLRAVREPPQDTRARVRGYYIQRSHRPDLLQVNWNEIELFSPLRHIPTPDPFYHKLPTD